MDYSKLITGLVDHIEQNSLQIQSIDELADYCNLSKYHFMRIFQAVANRSPKEYLDERRLVAAAKKLMDKNQKVIDISFECGYHSHEVFTRRFHQFFGISPLEFRREQPSFRLPEKIQVVERQFKNVESSIISSFKIKEMPDVELIGKACTFSPNNRDELNSVQGFVEDFAQHYIIPIRAPEMICVTRCEDTRDIRLYYFTGYHPSPNTMRSELLKFTVPGSQYAWFTYKGEMSDIHPIALADISRALITAGLQINKIGIDFFEVYRRDYRENGFNICVPIC